MQDSVTLFMKKFSKEFMKSKYVWLMLLPVIVYYSVFCYAPMYGIIIAFKNYSYGKTIASSPWVGLIHFRDFFSSFYFSRLIVNTLLLNLYGLIFVFPLPIILALSLNEVKNMLFKRVTQTISYLPHFISMVVIAGIIYDFLALNGPLNNLVVFITGGKPVPFLANAAYFRTIYIVSDIWQGIGWASIIYLSAIAGINPELYEAAIADGAGRIRLIWHVTLPGITSTVVILLILRIGTIMNLGIEKILLLQNPFNMPTSDVIGTFVYRRGIIEASYSYSTAVSLFNNVINFVLLYMANRISRRFNETSLW